MHCVHVYGLHVYCAVFDLDSFGFPGVRPTPGLTSSTQVVCVCVRAYTSTRPPTTPTPASLSLPKHSLPRQQQALTMAWTSWKKPHFQSPPTHAWRCQKNTCDTHACSREIGQYKQKKCAYMRAFVHPHACEYAGICINIHGHTYIHIHTYTVTHAHIYVYMHTHIHMPVYAHQYTDNKSRQQQLNTSSKIVDAHTFPYTYACTYIYIYAYTHMCTPCSECMTDV